MHVINPQDLPVVLQGAERGDAPVREPARRSTRIRCPAAARGQPGIPPMAEHVQKAMGNR